MKDASKETKEAFVKYMGAGYTPIGATDDPLGLNKNWIPNVIEWYNWFETQMESWGEGGMEEFIKGLEKKATSNEALSTMEKATLEFLKPLIYESKGFFPLFD